MWIQLQCIFQKGAEPKGLGAEVPQKLKQQCEITVRVHYNF